MKKILIIDDEEDIRQILAEFCEILGVDCKIASNGKEGLELFYNDNFDLILTDLKMPDMDGFDFVKKIREMNKEIPIAVCSGFIDDVNKNKIFEFGANYYLEKPFKLSELKKLFFDS